MSREDANNLLSGEDGRYLVRESVRNPGQYTLSLRCVFEIVSHNLCVFEDFLKDVLSFFVLKDFRG